MIQFEKSADEPSFTRWWVSEKHMPKYLAEFEYRMNLRKMPKLMSDLNADVPPAFDAEDVLEAPSVA